MPQIRVMPKPQKKGKKHQDMYPMTTKNANALRGGFDDSDTSYNANYGTYKPSLGGNLRSLEYKKVERKPRIDYEQLMAKVTKKMNGEEKPPLPHVYDAAKPDHKFNHNQIALRSIYKEIV